MGDQSAITASVVGLLTTPVGSPKHDGSGSPASRPMAAACAALAALAAEIHSHLGARSRLTLAAASLVFDFYSCSRLLRHRQHRQGLLALSISRRHTPSASPLGGSRFALSPDAECQYPAALSGLAPLIASPSLRRRSGCF